MSGKMEIGQIWATSKVEAILKISKKTTYKLHKGQSL